jgi:hypothetical protein
MTDDEGTGCRFGGAMASCASSRNGRRRYRSGCLQGLCHLAITLRRCMNIPARYCTGYLGDIGVPRDPAPMDSSAWFEVFLGGRWCTFDARHNHPVSAASSWQAAGTPLMLRSRQRLGWRRLRGFSVLTEEVRECETASTLMPLQSLAQAASRYNRPERRRFSPQHRQPRRRVLQSKSPLRLAIVSFLQFRTSKFIRILGTLRACDR